MIKSDTYTFKILRYDVKEPDKEPLFESYKIKVIPGLTVLAMLLRIRDEIDGTLSFRCSCRSAICGSCAMVINGKIDLACRTQVATFGTDTIILEPLPNFEIIKDLVVDMTPFWQMYEKIQPYLIRKSPAPEKEINQSEKDRKKIDQFVNCILCACCYGACPVLNRDPRDQRSAKALEIFNNEKGVWGCDTVFRCIDACPKDVRPTDGIVGLRKTMLKNKFKIMSGGGIK